MLTHLTIKTRLMFAIGVLALASVLVGGFGLYSLAVTNAALKTVYDDRLVAMAELGEVLTKIQENQSALAIAASGPAAAMPVAIDQVTKRIADISALWDSYMATYLTEEEKVLAKRFADSRGRFVAGGPQARPGGAAQRRPGGRARHRPRPAGEHLQAGARKYARAGQTASRCSEAGI